MQLRKISPAARLCVALSAITLMLVAGCSAPTPEPLVEMTPMEAPTPGATTPAPATPEPATAEPAPTEPVATEPAATEPAAEEPAPADGTDAAAQPDTEMAVVEQVDVQILESFPVQVQAVVTGYLPDGCTTITSVEAMQEGESFRIIMRTERPEDAMCTMAIVPFEEVVPLATADLPAGEYQVVVNDLTTTFTLPEGNVAPEEGDTTESGVGGASPTQTSDQDVVETSTEFVQAQVDVTMYDAPSADANVIGEIFNGQAALVTGASADGEWWRVICPDDTVGDCWVSAAPEMTLPTTPPQ